MDVYAIIKSKMIHDEICTYELCKLAKEKGFPQHPKENNTDQIYCWDNLRKLHSLCSCAMWYIGEYSREDMYAAPTQSLLQRWLREERGIMVEIAIWLQSDGSWRHRYKIQTQEDDIRTWIDYSTYELALEDALKYALENLT